MSGRWGLVLSVVLSAGLAVGCGDSQSSHPQQTGGAAPTSGASSTPDAGGPDALGGAEAGGGDSSSAGQPAVGCECDDGIACTLDDCSSGQCEHVVHHFACPTGQFCSATKGCAAGNACAGDADCVRPDNCVTATCDPATKRCVFAFLDGDHDGVSPVSCGGGDCNDADPAIYSGASEVCDGKDNDCDQELDPPLGSGCAEGKSCHAATCSCDAPTSSCGGICIDLTSDPANCGSCDFKCQETQTCAASECKCKEGLTKCGSKCVDLKSDGNNCGKCNNRCGDGECNDSACACPAETKDCSNNAVLSCKAINTDVANCGDCRQHCLTAGACSEGTCDTSLQWVKLYGGYASDHTYYHLAPMDVDASGSSFVGMSGEGGNTIKLPGGQTTLWSSRNVIAKFDAAGEFQWAMPSDVGFNDVAVLGSDVWVAAFVTYSTPTFSIAGQSFSIRNGYEAMTALVKLRGSDGAVLDHFQLDHTKWTTTSEPFLVHDDSKLWVVGTTVDLRRDDTIWQRPSGAYGGYIYPLGGTPLWLPGRVYYAVLDGAGKLVVTTTLAANASFTFGGDTFTTAQDGGQGFARYTKALVHEVSFVHAPTTQLAAGMPSPTFVDGYTTPLFTQVDDSGAVTKTFGGKQLPLHVSQARAQGGHLLLVGNGGSSPGTILGRSIPGGYGGLVMGFDPTSLQLQQAFEFSAELYSSYGYGRIDDFAFVDGGSSVLLSVLFDGGVGIGSQLIDVGNGYQGLALIKVKLN